METGVLELIGLIGRGLLIGLVLAVPVGPIGMLCIVRTLRHGRRVGLATGLGAATADAIYAAVAIGGLTTVTRTLIGVQKPLTLVGALALGVIGIRMIRAPHASVPTPGGVIGAYAMMPWQNLRAVWLGTVSLTLANPATILTFVGIFAGIATANESGSPVLASILLVGAVFVGSSCWWIILTGVVHAVRLRWLSHGTLVGPGIDRMHLLNACSGGVLIAFGLLAVMNALA